MTAARIINDGGRLFVRAPLGTWQAAGLYAGFPRTCAALEISIGCTSSAEAERLSRLVNTRANPVRTAMEAAQ